MAPHQFTLKGKALLYTSSAIVSLGDLMFGYSQGIATAAQVQPYFLKRFFDKDVTTRQFEDGQLDAVSFTVALTFACINIAAFLSSLLSAYVCDLFGRRMAFRAGAFLFLAASLVQIFAPNLQVIIAGRCIQGLGVGVISMVVPLYRCEIAPGTRRGSFVSLDNLFLGFGYTLSTICGYVLYDLTPSSETSWKALYVVQAALSVALFLGTFSLPESPRWLIYSGKDEQALQVLANFQGSGDVASEEVIVEFENIASYIQQDMSKEGSLSWLYLFTKHTRRTIMGVTVQMFQQMSGINLVLAFLPDNLKRAGFPTPKALLYGIICSLFSVAGTILPIFFIDVKGRKHFLIVGSLGLCIALAWVGGLQHFVDELPNRVGRRRTNSANKIFGFVCLYLFIYGASWGPVPWLLSAEVFPTVVRAKGMALSNASNWLWNFIMVFISPLLFNAVGAGAYFIVAGLCACSGLFVWLVYKETGKKTLEEIDEVFGHKHHRHCYPCDAGDIDQDEIFQTAPNTPDIAKPDPFSAREGNVQQSQTEVKDWEKEVAKEQVPDAQMIPDLGTSESIAIRHTPRSEVTLVTHKRGNSVVYGVEAEVVRGDGKE